MKADAASRRIGGAFRGDPAPGRMARLSCLGPGSAARAARRSSSPGWSRCPARVTASRCGNQRRRATAGCHLLRPGARAVGTAPGGAGHRGSAEAGAQAKHHRLRRLPVRPGSRQGHRRNQLAGRHPAQGADERRPAHRRPEKEAGQQRELLADRPAGCACWRESKKAGTRANTRSRFRASTTTTPRPAAIESGGTEKIAMWMLDTDYDGRSLFPRQVFFPMAGEKDGWARLAKNLKAEIDAELIEAYRGTVPSL